VSGREYIKHQFEEDYLGEQMTLPGSDNAFGKKKKK